jgi:hypothetical protein
VREEPLGHRGVPESELLVRPGLPGGAVRCHKPMTRWALPVRYRASAWYLSSAGQVHNARLSACC